jgi:1,4-alpha-glucan branching enzyme
VRFAVWAPNAERVSVVGDWNDFEGRWHPMVRVRRLGCGNYLFPASVQEHVTSLRSERSPANCA